MNEFQSTKNCKDCIYNCLKLEKTDASNFKILNEGKREIVYKKGETTIKQNSFASHIIYLKEGLIKIIIEGESERVIILKFIAFPQFISLSALENNVFSFTAIAVKTANVCIIKKENFNEILLKNLNVSSLVSKWYSADYRFIVKKLAVIGTKNVHGRFAQTLLYFAQKEFQDAEIYKHITRKELAEFGGMSSESTIKLLKEFKNDKLIETKGKKIIIKDIEMLKRLSRIG